MAHLLTYPLLAALVLTCSLLMPIPTYASEAIAQMRFCYEDQEYRPFLVASSDHQTLWGRNGALPDLVIETTRALNIQAEFVNFPWKRCIALLNAGEVDGIFAAIWQKAREAWGVFPKTGQQPDSRYSLWRVQYQVYTHKDSSLTWDGKSFSNIKTGIAAPLGYIAEQKLKQMGVLSRNSYTPNEGLRLVGLNRLDGFVVESNIGDHIVHDLNIQDEVMTLPTPFMTADWYLPLSHQWVSRQPELAQRFWQKLAEIREARADALKSQYSLMP